MSITTYTELQAAVASWLARGDLGSYIPDFITLGEQRIFYGSDDPSFPSPPLRIRAMEQATDPATYATSAGNATLALPAGFLEARVVALDTSPIADLDFASLKQVNALQRCADAGRPKVYSFRGDNLLFAPTPDAAYGVTLGYYKKLDPLAVTSSNWLLSNAPGIYLYAALLEAQPFLMNDARLPVWASMLGAATRALMRADEQDRWGGQLRLRADAGTP
jgi:hypothetical protein